jgi:hypothetical protein
LRFGQLTFLISLATSGKNLVMRIFVTSNFLGMALDFELFCLPVDRMSVAAFAEFLDFQPLSLLILAAWCRVIAGTALCTSKRYLFYHKNTP